MPIYNLINFAKSARGIQYFREDKTRHVASHAEKIKSAGVKYCDCPACTVAIAILGKKDLNIGSSMDKIDNVVDMKIVQEINQHASLELSAIIKPQ